MKKYLLAALSLIIVYNLYADTWQPPTIKTYFSQNGKYMIKVIPTEYPDKYWDWKQSKEKKKYSKSDTTLIPCHAILYHIYKNDTIHIWNKPLVNRVAPISAIVANDGSSIATFDNWSNLGYGNDVFVIYNENGELINKYELEFFSPFDIDDYMISVSSIWWRCGEKYSKSGLIEICCATAESEKLIYYNIQTKEFE